MKLRPLLLALPFVLPSCMPEVANEEVQSDGSAKDQVIANQEQRITRVESELHEMRLLFSNKLTRLEQMATLAERQRRELASRPSTPTPPPRSPQVQEPAYPTYPDEAPAPQAAQQTRPAGTYQIQRGDTLSEIAERRGVRLSALMAANPGIDPRRIRPGQSVQIPASNSGSRQVTAQRGSYKIQSGDTLSEIASRRGIPLSRLMAQNPTLDPKRLRIGQSIKIPAVESTPQQSQQIARTSNGPQKVALALPGDGPLAPEQPTAAPVVQEPLAPELPKRILVRIPQNKTLREIADELGTDVATLNRLNSTDFPPDYSIAARNAIYVPDFRS